MRRAFALLAIAIVAVAGCVFDQRGLTGRDAAARVEAGRADVAAREQVADAHLPAEAGVWRLRKKITVPAGKVPGTLADFPLAVWIDSDAQLAQGSRPDGHDITFRDANGSQVLDSELVRFDHVYGELVAWVKLPQLSSTAPTVLWLYYGNPTAPSPPPAPPVWSNGFAGVWHLFGGIHDSGPLQLPAVAHGGATATPYGCEFDGEPGSYVELGGGPLSQNGTFTLETWFLIDEAQPLSWIGMASKGRASDTEWTGLWLDTKGALVFGWSGKPPGGGNLDSPVQPPAGDWHHAAGTFDGTTMRVYYDGQKVGERANSYNAISGPLTLGTDRYASNPSLIGSLQEVMLSTVARSADWLAAEFASQLEPAKFYQLGPEEQVF